LYASLNTNKFISNVRATKDADTTAKIKD